MSDTIDSSTQDVAKLKVAELKKELKARGLSTVGNKTDLIERLKGTLGGLKGTLGKATPNLTSQQSVLSDSLLLDEDVLNDEELEEKEEKSAPAIENTITLKRPIELVHSKPLETKVTDKSSEIPSNEVEILSNEEQPKKIIKISSFTEKERLEMRAKKFGTPLSTEMKKVARAERFGLNKSIAPSEDASLEVLKKRAERFGTSVSKKLFEVEAKEKLQKRKERFGSIQNSSITTSTAVKIIPSMSNAEKAQLRLKRFNMEVK